MSEKSRKKDWIGEWFRLQRERGERTDIWILWKRSKDSQFETHSLDHAIHDGWTAFLHVIREAKLLDRELLVQLKGKFVLNPLLFPLGVIRFLFKSRRPVSPLSFTEPSEPVLPDPVQVIDFTIQETLTFKAHCKKIRIPFPIFLLSTLDQAVRECAPELKLTQWMIPVTTRKEVTGEEVSGNEASYFDIQLEPGDSLEKLKTKFKRAYFFQEAWVNHFLLNIGRFIGTEGMRKLLEKKGGGAFRTGALSGCGQWGSAHHPLNESIVGGAAPTWRVQPLSCAWLIWMDKLVLTVRIHPELVQSEALCEKISEAWKTRVLNLT